MTQQHYHKHHEYQHEHHDQHRQKHHIHKKIKTAQIKDVANCIVQVSTFSTLSVLFELSLFCMRCCWFGMVLSESNNVSGLQRSTYMYRAGRAAKKSG